MGSSQERGAPFHFLIDFRADVTGSRNARRETTRYFCLGLYRYAWRSSTLAHHISHNMRIASPYCTSRHFVGSVRLRHILLADNDEWSSSERLVEIEHRNANPHVNPNNRPTPQALLEFLDTKIIMCEGAYLLHF